MVWQVETPSEGSETYLVLTPRPPEHQGQLCIGLLPTPSLPSFSPLVFPPLPILPSPPIPVLFSPSLSSLSSIPLFPSSYFLFTLHLLFILPFLSSLPPHPPLLSPPLLSLTSLAFFSSPPSFPSLLSLHLFPPYLPFFPLFSPFPLLWLACPNYFRELL